MQVEKNSWPEVYKLVAELLNTWIIWRDNHDITDPKLCCCQHSRDLFEDLAKLERWVRGDN